MSTSRPARSHKPARAGSSASPVIRLVVAAPQPWTDPSIKRRFGRGLGFLLSDGRDLGAKLLDHCRSQAPCVLIIDLAAFERLPSAEFMAAADFGRAIQTLVTGPQADEATVQSLLRAGCMGFVPEDATPRLLKQAIRAVASGELWIERQVVTQVLRKLLTVIASPRLTPREIEILRLIANGCKNRAISEKLCISRETVRWHIRGIHGKLGIQDRLGTALYARQYLDTMESV